MRIRMRILILSPDPGFHMYLHIRHMRSVSDHLLIAPGICHIPAGAANSFQVGDSRMYQPPSDF